MGGVCRLLGHRYAFTADGATMTWSCERCGAVGGSKTYASAERARRHAAVFDRRDADALGRRAPLLGMFPLRILAWLRRRRR